MLDRSEFTKLVQDALKRLHDSPYLQHHPLTAHLVNGSAGTFQASQEVRRLLLQAIRTLRPAAGTPPQSADWRNYQLLELRYLEGLSPAEVMARLALSKSQYFRDQAHILEALAADLWARRQKATVGATPVSKASVTRDDLAHAAVERLRTAADWQPIHIGHLLEDLRPLVEPLAKTKGAKLRFDVPHALAGLHVDRVMLRQSLLSVITYALDLCPGGALSISTFGSAAESGIAVVATSATPFWCFPDLSQDTRLQVSAELMAAMGGTLASKEQGDNGWAAYFVWPTTARRSLLVVDDNDEFANLCCRYLAAYHWQVLGANSGAEARRIVLKQRPTVILLDVMLPKEDGWELLMAFKAARATQHIPVIICSVLNEAALATTLGAAAYLTKPLSQQTLLRTLARCSPAGIALVQ